MSQPHDADRQAAVLGRSVALAPVRHFEKLGFHHGEGVWRVRCGDEIYNGMTAEEAMAGAIIATYEQTGPFTIHIQ